ncbi:hypothetical protein ACFYOT_19095 [Saccharothrix saharensis]
MKRGGAARSACTVVAGTSGAEAGQSSGRGAGKPAGPVNRTAW